MNFDELCRIERSAEMVSSTVRRIAHPDLYFDLTNMTFIISEVRQAGYFLCDPDCTPEMQEAAARRLLDVLFHRNPRP